MMKQMSAVIAALCLSLGASQVMAANTAECEKQAVSKDGKPLAGAAKTSFMKKCSGGDAAKGADACEAKAVDKNGKALAGAAKTSFMKKCAADSK